MVTYLAKIDINDEATGMHYISLVENPAVETEWMAFEADKMNVYKVEDNEQHIITGVVMRANFPILKEIPNKGKCYLKYEKETLKQMALKFFKNGEQNNITITHNHAKLTDKVNIFEMYIKDVERGINPKGFENIEDGSLMASFKVNDEQLWSEIKEGKWKGFSLEGAFRFEEETTDEDEIYRLVEKIKSHIINKKNEVREH